MDLCRLHNNRQLKNKTDNGVGEVHSFFSLVASRPLFASLHFLSVDMSIDLYGNYAINHRGAMRIVRFYSVEYQHIRRSGSDEAIYGEISREIWRIENGMHLMWAHT